MSEVLDALNVLVNSGMTKQSVVEVAQNMLDGDNFEDDDDKKIVALIIHTRGSLDIEDIAYDAGCAFKADGEEFLVLDENEVESRIDDSLENMLEDCEGSAGPYFDRERWERDVRMESDGDIIGSYDGNVYEYADLTIFRTN